MHVLVTDASPAPRTIYFGYIGEKEVAMIRTGPSMFKVVSEVVGTRQDEEGTKSVWRTLPEAEQFEVKM